MSLQLRNNENIQLTVDIHWSNYIFAGIMAFFGTLIMLGAIINTTSNESTTPTIGPILLATFFFVPLLYKFLSNKCKVYAITNQRFYIEEGILAKNKLDIPFNKINDIQMNQGILQRMFGAGNISVLTGNSNPKIIKGINKPNEFKEQMFNVISANSSQNAA